jgi:hypothetical protein
MNMHQRNDEWRWSARTMKGYLWRTYVTIAMHILGWICVGVFLWSLHAK